MEKKKMEALRYSHQNHGLKTLIKKYMMISNRLKPLQLKAKDNSLKGLHLKKIEYPLYVITQVMYLCFIQWLLIMKNLPSSLLLEQ